MLNREQTVVYSYLPIIFSLASWPTLLARVITVSIILDQFSLQKETTMVSGHNGPPLHWGRGGHLNQLRLQNEEQNKTLDPRYVKGG
jgi:hypothetical protein